MKLKQISEDFIVREIPNRTFDDNGDYMICLLKKTNYNTEDAVFTLSKVLGTSRKNIGFAGNKDRNAITFQYISLFKGAKERLENLNLKDIKLTPVGKTRSPLSLGDLKGNLFEITIRDLDKDQRIIRKERFPNYFDYQRFSQNNVAIGKSIIKKDFKNACEILLKDKKYGPKISEFLKDQPRNYVQALHQIPMKILMIMVHSFQSKVWNETVKEMLSKGIEKEQVPLVGFEDIEDEELQRIIQTILKRENINQRDFIIREFPSLTVEGTKRKMFCEINDLEIGKVENDELNPGKYKTKVKFWLQKGSYATMCIKYLLGEERCA